MKKEVFNFRSITVLLAPWHISKNVYFHLCIWSTRHRHFLHQNKMIQEQSFHVDSEHNCHNTPLPNHWLHEKSVPAFKGFGSLRAAPHSSSMQRPMTHHQPRPRPCALSSAHLNAESRSTVWVDIKNVPRAWPAETRPAHRTANHSDFHFPNPNSRKGSSKTGRQGEGGGFVNRDIFSWTTKKHLHTQHK